MDCADPQCSGHGVCVRGECVCSAGWAGVSCDDPLPACQEQCSGHGTYLPESDTCACQPNWTGPDCYTGKVAAAVAQGGRGEEGRVSLHIYKLHKKRENFKIILDKFASFLLKDEFLQIIFPLDVRDISGIEVLLLLL